MSNNPKAKPRYNKGTDSWNVFVEAGGKEFLVGSTMSYGEVKTTEWNTKEDAIEWINNSPFELKEENNLNG